MITPSSDTPEIASTLLISASPEGPITAPPTR